jgi:hypothetical protein
MIQESRYLRFQKIQKLGFHFLQGGYLQHPKTGLIIVYLDEIIFIVAAKDELAKELDLPFILALGLQLIDIGRAQILDALGQLFLIEKHLVDADQELVRPIGVELAAETVIGEVGHVVVEHYLQPFKKCTLACGPFLGYQTEDR